MNMMILATLSLLSALLVQNDLAEKLRELDSKVLPAEEPRMIGHDARVRIEEANRRESQAWAAVQSREDWEKYRDAKVQALRASFGATAEVPKDLSVKVTKKLDGEGFRIENLVFESRPELVVTANLYVPAPERPSMPGLVIIHSHHNPKTQAELQDMGMTWARLGCYVLIMDQVGHGERRQHPFVDASSYPGTYRVGRQDYFFRYVTAMQLHLVGESLIGWMAWDTMRGVDLLLGRPGIDKSRIILLGSVAGGGDPAAVTAALDPRIAAVVPFNFGGPQPETKYPLPQDAEMSFNYAGGGSWESTRNLRLSARDGFLPWVIVASVAPRRLIHAHEFAWDRDHDPVWKRYEKIFGFYNEPGGLSFCNGRGAVTGQPPEATHCNNIGPVHRQGIYPSLEKWFGIPAAGKEYQERRPAADLACLPPGAKPRLVHQLAKDLAGTSRPKASRLRDHWSFVLGDTQPQAGPKVTEFLPLKVGDVTVERTSLEVEPGIVVPLVLLLPAHEPSARMPVVVGVSQGGKQDFLKKRSDDLAALLKGGAAVCLPDLRGTGETRPGDSRGRGSEGTSIAATELMVGRTLLGLRIRDLRSVLRYVRGRSDLDGARLALWGDSAAPPNPADRRFDVPIDADRSPELAEPLGALAVLLAALYEPEVGAILARGGLVSYRSLLESPFCYVPFDAVVPGGAKLTDLPETVALLPVRSIRLENLVDGWNRLVPKEEATKAYTPAALDTTAPSMAWLLKTFVTR
jgi:dienelactone hydrolase